MSNDWFGLFIMIAGLLVEPENNATESALIPPILTVLTEPSV